MVADTVQPGSPIETAFVMVGDGRGQLLLQGVSKCLHLGTIITCSAERDHWKDLHPQKHSLSPDENVEGKMGDGCRGSYLW